MDSQEGIVGRGLELALHPRLRSRRPPRGDRPASSERARPPSGRAKTNHHFLGVVLRIPHRSPHNELGVAGAAVDDDDDRPPTLRLRGRLAQRLGDRRCESRRIVALLRRRRRGEDRDAELAEDVFPNFPPARAERLREIGEDDFLGSSRRAGSQYFSGWRICSEERGGFAKAASIESVSTAREEWPGLLCQESVAADVLLHQRANQDLRKGGILLDGAHVLRGRGLVVGLGLHLAVPLIAPHRVRFDARALIGHLRVEPQRELDRRGRALGQRAEREGAIVVVRRGLLELVVEALQVEMLVIERMTQFCARGRWRPRGSRPSTRGGKVAFASRRRSPQSRKQQSPLELGEVAPRGDESHELEGDLLGLELIGLHVLFELAVELLAEPLLVEDSFLHRCREMKIARLLDFLGEALRQILELGARRREIAA